MKITDEEVKKVALLARLQIQPQETALYAAQLNDILVYAEALNQVATNGVEPTAHVLNVTNVFRADQAAVSLSNEAALQNAPQQADGTFVVPRIM